MISPHVYDKGKYHAETVEARGFPEEHASNHTVFFLRQLIENGLRRNGSLKRQEAGMASIHDLYDWRDCCLIDDMRSDAGNAVAMEYFHFEKGKYLNDYTGLLQGTLPSECPSVYAEENYARMTEVIDRRFTEWRSKRL